MSGRFDSIGMFWEDHPVEKARSSNQPITRTRPPVPDTGWRPPARFPDLSGAEWIGIDIEGYDPGLQMGIGPGVRHGGFIAGISLAVPEGKSWYFPIAHEGPGNMDPDIVLRYLRNVLCRPNQPKIGANLLYDLDYLYEAGVHVEGPFYDIQNAEPLLDEYRDFYSLDALAHDYLGEGKVNEDLYKWLASWMGGNPTRGQQAKHIWKAPPELVGPYAEGDALLPIRIFEKQIPRLKSDGLWDLFLLESRLIPLLLAMRRRGVRVDEGAADRLGETLDLRIRRDQTRLDEMAGRSVNVNSSLDLVLLFDKLGIPYGKTRAGNPSFPRPWLENHEAEIAGLILNVRKWEKFKGTFIDGYIKKFALGGRIHCQFNQLKSDQYGTVSGRFSSSNPNLQNIPIRDPELGPLLRAIFIPDPGHIWQKDDYSQIEYRLFVHFAYETFKNSGGILQESVRGIREEYQKNPDTDYHTLAAGWAKMDRKPAKNLNFGKIYGMGKKSMMEQYGWTEGQADHFLELYDKYVPFASAILEKAGKIAENRGYIKTILNRRGRFPFWEPRDRPKSGRWDPLKREEAEQEWPGKRLKRALGYTALNKLLQGSAADIMKQGMVEIWESGICDVIGPPLLTVHDELDWSVPPTPEAAEAMAEGRRIMESCVPLNIPVFVDSERGPNWGDVK